MKHLVSLFTLLCVALSAAASTKYFIADEDTNFSNPERGFYTASEQDITATTAQSNLTDAEFDAASGRSLILRQYVFSGFRDKDLTQTVLDLIAADFATCRKNGFKCVVRYSYTVSEEKDAQGKYQDGSPEIWARHLVQLKPVMAANADVIATVQAGFLGVWGEWYYSSQGEGADIPVAVKNKLIDQLLDAVPASRTVQLRTPKHKQNYIGDSEPLTLAEAYTETARARLGHHNDAFLYEATNMGTYKVRSKDMDYLDKECLYVPNGGESDVLTTEVYEKWATGEKAKADMAKVHFSYLNQDFSPLVISNWKQEGAFIEIARNMGYRFQLIEATLPALVRPTNKLSVHFNVRNVGYATVYNERHAYVVLTNSDTTYALPLASDPRLWAPNSALTEVDEQLTLPASVKEGTYDVALWLPDACSSLQADPRYAVRMANVGIWDETTGYNKLGMEVLISATQPEPQPQPEPTPQADVDPITQLKGAAGFTEAHLSWINPGGQKLSDTIVVNMAQGIDTAYNGPLGNSSATATYADGVTTVNYTTDNIWLWAGARFPVDNLTGVTSISFELKGDGQQVMLYPYAHDGTYRWIEDAFTVMLTNKAWTKYTFYPSNPLWVDDTPAHKFGDKPIVDISFIANPAGASSGSFQLRNIIVVKERKIETNFAGVRILRKEGAEPTGYNDGTTIYFGTADHCTDAGLERDHTYYYAAYAVDKNGKIANPAKLTLTIDGSNLEQVVASSPKESTRKVLYQGQLLIIRNGQIYTLQGTPITYNL